MILKINTCLFLLLFASYVFSQELIKPVRNINPNSIEFSDLFFLKNILKDAKIVSLGEQSHSDGATFNAKVRLIKYLHEDLGYNVIAFESGLYDCTKANELIKNRRNGNDTNYLFQSIFGIWHTEEVNYLATYIDETQKTANPLILTGFDCQFAGEISKIHFIKDFYQFIRYIETISKQSIQIDTAQMNKSLKLYFKYSNYFNKLEQNDTLIINNAITQISNIIDGNQIKSDTISYWIQLFSSIQVDYRRKYFNIVSRDSMMAKNVEWLANNKFKNQKIILWAANTHIANSTKSVKSNYLSSHKLMGSYLSNTFGQQYYSLAFTSFNGEVTGKWFLDKLIMGKPKKKSIESFFHKTGYNYAFLNIKEQNNKDNQYFFNSKLFGHTPRKMNIHSVVDGIFYIKEMYPATYNY